MILKFFKNIIYLKKKHYFILTQSYLRNILSKMWIYFEIISVL